MVVVLQDETDPSKTEELVEDWMDEYPDNFGSVEQYPNYNSNGDYVEVELEEPVNTGLFAALINVNDLSEYATNPHDYFVPDVRAKEEGPLKDPKITLLKSKEPGETPIGEEILDEIEISREKVVLGPTEYVAAKGPLAEGTVKLIEKYYSTVEKLDVDLAQREPRRQDYGHGCKAILPYPPGSNGELKTEIKGEWQEHSDELQKLRQDRIENWEKILE